MKKTLSLLFAAIAITASSCLAQTSSIQESPAYSNISSYAPESAPAEAPLPPYEVSITLKTLLSWEGMPSKSIALQKGQDLLVYIDNPNHWENANRSGFQKNMYNIKNTVRCDMLTLNWGGWNNWLGETPLLENQELHTNGDPLCYHLKANHTGETKVVFQNTTAGVASKIYVTVE